MNEAVELWQKYEECNLLVTEWIKQSAEVVKTEFEWNDLAKVKTQLIEHRVSEIPEVKVNVTSDTV